MSATPFNFSTLDDTLENTGIADYNAALAFQAHALAINLLPRPQGGEILPTNPLGHGSFTTLFGPSSIFANGQYAPYFTYFARPTINLGSHVLPMKGGPAPSSTDFLLESMSFATTSAYPALSNLAPNSPPSINGSYNSGPMAAMSVGSGANSNSVLAADFSNLNELAGTGGLTTAASPNMSLLNDFISAAPLGVLAPTDPRTAATGFVSLNTPTFLKNSLVDRITYG